MSSLIPKFSLRSLLLGVMVCAVFTSLYVVWFMKSSEQRFLERARAEGNFLGYGGQDEIYFGRSIGETSRKRIVVSIVKERKLLDFLEMANDFIIKKNLPVYLFSKKPNAIPPDQVFQIFDLPNLAVICLTDWRLPEGLAELKLQTQGELAVFLDRCELSKESLAWLLTMPNLRVLELCQCKLEDDWFAEIDPASCNVTHLVAKSHLGQRFFEFVGKLKKLKYLEVCEIKTSELQEILKLSSLDTLLVSSGFSDESVRLLLSSQNAPKIVYAYEIPNCPESGIEFIDLTDREPRFDLDEILTLKESDAATSEK